MGKSGPGASQSNAKTGAGVKIGLVCLRGAINIASWRGSADSFQAALVRQGVDVSRIEISKERLGPLFKAKQFFVRNVLKRGYTRHREPSMLRHYSRLVEQAAAARGVDYIIALTTMPIAQVSTSTPVLFWNDAPFAGMLNWYPEFSRLRPKSVAHGHAMEIEAHKRVALAIYSSRWAADIAIGTYGADAERVKVVDFGPNIPVTWDRQYVSEQIAVRLRKPYRLAWIGVDWERKGGDVAVSVARLLHDAGVPIELAVAGVNLPRAIRELPFVNVMGFLSKSAVTQLLDSATFLLLPSRADLSPIVFNEASSLGVPVISRPIGGIPEIIHDGRNGKLFPESTPHPEIASYIRATIEDSQAYSQLALNAYHEYETRLNWDVAARRIIDLIVSIDSQRRERLPHLVRADR